MREEIRKIQSLMESAEYVTDAPVATSVHLALSLRKPLLIEGHAGVGKTEVAKVMARMLETNLIRLQCYEGLDASAALYEWNYQKQLLHIKLRENEHHSIDQEEHERHHAAECECQHERRGDRLAARRAVGDQGFDQLFGLHERSRR